MKRVSRQQHEHIKKGRSYSCALFTLRVLPSSDGAFRFAPVVSKKVAKSAVVRNTVKRRLREAARLHENNMQGLTVVAYAKKPITEASFAGVQEALTTILPPLR